MSLSRVGGWSLGLGFVLAFASGCNSPSKPGSGSGGTGGQRDASTNPDTSSGTGGKGGMMACGASSVKATDLGQACACNSDCGSGNCVDGVCCNVPCTGKCMSCNLPGSEGTCGAVPAGVNPRVQTECEPSADSTCGQDGTCDGKGGCRRHVMGTICQAGVCDGDGMSGINICDGEGRCRPGPTESCFPYTCGGNKCLAKCMTSSDCSAGRPCVGNSCGKLPNGRGPCTTGDECSSGFCADGVCCNVACAGECVSCSQTGSMGQCRPLGAGLRHAMCAVQAKATCGTTGVCDGFGSCAKHPAETTCVVPKCAGNMLNTAGTCDGEGVCRAPGQIDCAPFMCAGDGCVKTCTTDAQCVAPNVCMNGSCGKKPMGSPCAMAAQCESNQCVDGVCCDTACTGACQSCALQSSLGICKNVASGAVDPHGVCMDTGATSCGTDGKCDGSGGCRKYTVDTVCGPETCEGGAYTPPSTCNASGQCIPPDSQTCAPFACNGSKCRETCNLPIHCVGTASCVEGSCGLKPAGARCSLASECQHAPDLKQYCSQGVCCNGPCTTACQACNLAGSLGRCTAVANNVVDPQKKCATTAASTCGTNGRCRGGVCDTYHTTDQCRAASCSNATTMLEAAFCDGRGGACPAATSTGCGVYTCDTATGMCKSSCTTNADCTGSNTCNGGSCGKKSNGASCSAGAQCLSGNCTEGVCCNTACSDPAAGVCLSCRVAGRVGTCSAVALGGADPKGRCLASARTSCGLNGTCDGGGKCDFWDATTGCRNQSCTGSTQTNTANCDGNGACPAATTKACNPYMCNVTGGACRTTCTSNADCNVGVTCNTQTNRCGDKLPNGRVCAAGGDCASAFCVKAQAADASGVCCDSACTGGCQTCGTGTCTNAAAGSVPRLATMCPVAAGNVCGNTGRCNAAGGCQIAGPSTPCSDGNACTTGDACMAGTCRGTARTCTASDQCHVAGTCDPATGACSNPAAPVGTSCADTNRCNGTETCNAAGVCGAGTPLTCAQPTACQTGGGACVPTTGCPPLVNRPVGSSCGDSDPCDGSETCNAMGMCVAGGTPLTCPQPNACQTGGGACIPGVGCPPLMNKPAGTSCADSNLCDGAETCNGMGVCSAGGAPLTCPQPNACQTGGGACVPATGCPELANKPAGASCADANLCDGTETCNGMGVCSTGGTPMTCPQPSICQTGGGACVPGVGCPPLVNKDMGTSCADANRCDGTETCNATGQCVAGTPVACNNPPVCRVAGACSAATGLCVYPPAPLGDPCPDADMCDGAETCNGAGVCAGGTAVVCPAPAVCRTRGMCNAVTGVCSAPGIAANGSDCNDGNACTTGDSCQSGTCTGTPMVCPADECQLAGTCSSGTCSASPGPAPDGTPCRGSSGMMCCAGACAASCEVANMSI